MESLLENLTLNEDEKVATPPSLHVELDLEAPPPSPPLPQYNLPPELWRKIFIHSSPSRVLDNGCTNSIEEQEGSLCGLGFWRISHSSQYNRYNICLVSHAFRELCIPLLYRDVKLSSSRAILNFARTILSTDPPPSIDFAPLTLRMDVDLSPYLNEHDENGEPVMGPDFEGVLVEKVFEEGSEVEMVARLLKALVGLKMFLWDSTENLHTLPSLILDAIVSSECGPNMVGLDWFPVAEANLLSFFSLLHTIQNIEHLEIGEALELFVLRSLFCFAFPRRVPLVRADLLPFLPFVLRAYEYNPPPSWTRIDLPKLHTLAISGDGMSTCKLFAEMSLPSLRRITHWSGLSPGAIWTLDQLVRNHGSKLEVLSLWSPSGREAIGEDQFNVLIREMLSGCGKLVHLELDIFLPWPLPPQLPHHPTLRFISLGLELLPLKETLPPHDVLLQALESSPMDELVRSISRRTFPKLESLHLLSCDAAAMGRVGGGGGAGKTVKEAWGMLPGWLRWARKDSQATARGGGGEELTDDEVEDGREEWVVKDGWGDVLREEEWSWLEEKESEEEEEEKEEKEEESDASLD
ncbi:hypothetical protein BDY24DRAFT_95565 [Mrakia frigida]|uniref:uncharacterized protein n=1 Tax=Mrakia frigida TaxID=29902 RepID=UPI003FCC0F5B